jgi:formyltetrahydrofolate hydrolase
LKVDSGISKNTAILLIHCPDKQGILATVTEFLNTNNGNIIYLVEYLLGLKLLLLDLLLLQGQKHLCILIQ